MTDHMTIAEQVLEQRLTAAHAAAAAALNVIEAELAAGQMDPDEAKAAARLVWASHANECALARAEAAQQLPERPAAGDQSARAGLDPHPDSRAEAVDES